MWSFLYYLERWGFFLVLSEGIENVVIKLMIFIITICLDFFSLMDFILFGFVDRWCFSGFIEMLVNLLINFVFLSLEIVLRYLKIY